MLRGSGGGGMVDLRGREGPDLQRSCEDATHSLPPGDGIDCSHPTASGALAPGAGDIPSESAAQAERATLAEERPAAVAAKHPLRMFGLPTVRAMRAGRPRPWLRNDDEDWHQRDESRRPSEPLTLAAESDTPSLRQHSSQPDTQELEDRSRTQADDEHRQDDYGQPVWFRRDKSANHRPSQARPRGPGCRVRKGWPVPGRRTGYCNRRPGSFARMAAGRFRPSCRMPPARGSS